MSIYFEYEQISGKYLGNLFKFDAKCIRTSYEIAELKKKNWELPAS
jgi:hypothetical protein